MVAILMSAKKATPGLLKINVFWNKDYDVITGCSCHVHDVPNKILSRNSDYTVDVVMWPKFGNSSIYIKVIIKRSGLGWSLKLWDWHYVWPWNFIPMWQIS